MLAKQQELQHLNAHGSIEGIESKLMMFAGRQKVLDAQKYKDLERKYA